MHDQVSLRNRRKNIHGVFPWCDLEHVDDMWDELGDGILAMSELCDREMVARLAVELLD